MYCPRCGSTQDNELKFCKSCGANLYAVRQVVDTREPAGPADRNQPWFADIAVRDAESRRRKEELDHQRGLTPQIKRYNEIKAGVITSSVGISVSIILLVLMHGIVLGENVSPAAAEILSRLWIAGLGPFFVGLALIINGMVVSKKLIELTERSRESALLEEAHEPEKLRAANTNEFISSPQSVTEGTTRHLKHEERG
jgi:hypothetical protein